MGSFTYTTAKNMIVKKMYGSIYQMQQMLDVFSMSGKLTYDEYIELTELLATHN